MGLFSKEILWVEWKLYVSWWLAISARLHVYSIPWTTCRRSINCRPVRFWWTFYVGKVVTCFNQQLRHVLVWQLISHVICNPPERPVQSVAVFPVRWCWCGPRRDCGFSTWLLAQSRCFTGNPTAFSFKIYWYRRGYCSKFG